MKRLLQLASVLALAVVVVVSRAGRAPGADDTARAAALKLFQSLSDDQKKLAVKDLNDKERSAEQFPAVVRPGLPFAMLTAEQKTLVNDVLRAMTSEYGASRCLAVGKQTPENRRYLNFFGDPAAGKRFAWRIAQHHLTLVYAEFGTDPAHEFGPILLGGNPVKDLWDAEEKIALDLYASLSPQEVQAIEGKGKASPSSGAPIGKSGLRIAELGTKPQTLARSLLQQRLAVFSPDRRKVLEALIQRDGGIDNLRIAFWGAATKSQKDGGTYHWRIGSATVVCDWQTVGRNHIHMTVRGRSKG